MPQYWSLGEVFLAPIYHLIALLGRIFPGVSRGTVTAHWESTGAGGDSYSYLREKGLYLYCNNVHGHEMTA